MRSATNKELGKAHLALVKGTSIATVTSPEWFKDNFGDEGKLNYSQTWRYHTRQFIIGNGQPCAHCAKALGGHDDISDLAAIADNDTLARVAIGKAIAEGQSWGLISVRLGNNGIAQGAWPESRVRREFREQADRHDKGLRPAHKGGRFVANRPDLYDDEVALGTRSDGYIRKADEALPPLEGGQVSDEVREQRKADLQKRKAAHQRTLNAIKAQYAKLIKEG